MFQTSACSNLGDHRPPMFEEVIQTSALYYAEVRQPMVAELSLFEVAEVPTNMCDYTLPSLSG